MVRMNINIDSEALVQLQSTLARLGAGSMPVTAGAMKSAAGFVRDTWRGYAGGGALPGVEPLKRPHGGYARSIKIQRNGPFDYEIYSEAKVAGWIENGTDEIDMKETHTKGPRSRISKPDKDGKTYSYLIVPFRWGTPGAIGFKNIIPEAVYNMLLTSKKYKFQTSKTNVSADKSNYRTPNNAGQMVGRAQYTWGDRVFTADVDSLTDGNKEDHFADNMVKMEKQGRGSTGYFTFRIISSRPGTKGWIKPATRPRPVTHAVASVTRDTINKTVDAAIREDLGL
jgi:hypothetical protein